MTFKVEHESIDLVDKTLAKYNEELLRLAGVLSRIIYENELENISNSYNNDDEQMIDYLQNYAAHILTHFTFR